VPPEGTAQGQDYTPTNKFTIAPWPVRYSELLDPDLNVNLGTQILAWNVKTFGMPRGIAVYNRWAERKAPIDGPFANQAYVDKVLKQYRELTGD
jgi:hypothetical protein